MSKDMKKTNVRKIFCAEYFSKYIYFLPVKLYEWYFDV